MNARDKKRFAVSIGALGETFGRAVTEATIRAYEIGLDGLPIDDVERAIARAMTAKKFMPVPAELRELTGEVPEQDRAIIAWSAVVRALNMGICTTLTFDDPAVNDALRCLGGFSAVWNRWRAEMYEDTGATWLRKDFERTYNVYHRRGVTAEEGGTLSGDIDGCVVYPNITRRIATTLTSTRVLGDPPRKAIGNSPKLLQDASAGIGKMPEDNP